MGHEIAIGEDSNLTQVKPNEQKNAYAKPSFMMKKKKWFNNLDKHCYKQI